MNIRQLWLLKPGVSVPARWEEAFPHGEAMDLQQLLSRTDISPGGLHVLWLAATDGNWIEHVRQVLCIRPAERVVVLSAMPNDKEALRAVAAGARGYAHTHAVPALLRELALVVEHGGYWLGPGPMRLLLDRATHAMAAPAPAADGDPDWQCLSAREADVALAVQEGRSNKEIARLLGISERTVKAHLGAAFEKLGVRDRLQMVLRLPSRQLIVAPVPPSNRNATRAGLT
jgi:DNA-binding NarL/FixJ family response regulator